MRAGSLCLLFLSLCDLSCFLHRLLVARCVSRGMDKLRCLWLSFMTTKRALRLPCSSCPSSSIENIPIAFSFGHCYISHLSHALHARQTRSVTAFSHRCSSPRHITLPETICPCAGRLRRRHPFLLRSPGPEHANKWQKLGPASHPADPAHKQPIGTEKPGPSRP